jgi:hemolysin activation/secretion protein
MPTRVWRCILIALLWITPAILRAQTLPTTQPLAAADTLLLKQVRFEGNRAVSTARLEQEILPYLNRRVSVDELEELRLKLTQLYIDAGYITSGVILPDQDVDPENGVILFQVIEGKLRRQDISLQAVDAANQPTKPWLRPSYVTNRVMIGAGDALNINRLKDSLEQLRQNPNIKRINAELQPGTEPGESKLDIKFEQATWFHAGIEFNNQRPPSVGANRFELFAYTNNLTSNGDTLSLRYTINKGTLDEWEWAGLDEYSVAYSLPLNAVDTTLDLIYERDDSPVVDEPFDELDITSKTDSFYIGLRQPVFRTTTAQFDYSELILSAGFSFKQNTSELLGEPFSFSPGADNGRTRASVVRLGQELNFRNQDRAMSFRSIFSIGVDAFGATEGELGVDSQFLAWLGQFQYVWRLPRTEHLLIFRASGQAANDSLPSLEQFSVGGMNTVRGYPENQLVRDNAFAATVEYRHSLWQRSGASVLEIAPFFDVGGGRDNHTFGTEDGNGDVLCSAGVGVLFHPNEQFSATIYYGYAFKDFDQTSDLQDIGIHFAIVYQPF